METQTPLPLDQIKNALSQAGRFIKLDRAEAPDAKPLWDKMAAELGEDRWMDFIELAESRLDAGEKVTDADRPAKPKGLFRQPRRVSKHPETWRCLNNYPKYEISSHGRVRALDRAKPEDWLKPRRRWYKGVCTESVVIQDRDGRRREIFVGKLLIAAGFMDRPAWMKTAT